MFNIRTSKLFRLINQNFIEILFGVIAIIIIIVVLQVLNNNAKEKRKNQINNTVISSQKDITEETVIYGENVKDEVKESNNSIIDTFFEYCNSSDAEAAYSLISNDCKEQLYPTLDDFVKLYYNQIFTTSRTYSMQSWVSSGKKYTYKVQISEDMLATGVYDKTKQIEDYITVVKENDETRLNINSYIGAEEINKTVEIDGVAINVSKKHMYMNYEQYELNVENKSEFHIMLDGKRTVSSTYLLSDTNVKYSSFIDEVASADLKVNSGDSKLIKIKFNKMYNPNIKIEKIAFLDITQGYVSDEQIENADNFKGSLNVEIEI